MKLDLRADLGGFYGNQDIIYTPNIDAFQNRAFTFTHVCCTIFKYLFLFK